MTQKQIEELKQAAQELGVKFKGATYGDASKQGIHLLHPTTYELEDALCVAERDGFKTIYIHNNETWMSKAA